MHQWLTRSWTFLRELAAGVDTAHAVMLGLEPGAPRVASTSVAVPGHAEAASAALLDVVVPDTPAALFGSSVRTAHRRLSSASRLAGADLRRRNAGCRHLP